MKFGIIGYAHNHINKFIKQMIINGHEFTGIYDNKIERAKKIQEKYNVPVYENVQDIINSGIDIAGTSAENHLKIDIIEKCESKGIHIMSDKPIVINRNDLERLKKIISNKKIQIGVMFEVRFMPAIYTLWERVKNGDIGRLLNIEISSPHKLSPGKREEWFFDKKKNGGIIIDLMVHSIDIFNWITQDEICDSKGITVKTILPEKESFYDSSQVFALTSKGINGFFSVNWHNPPSYWSWGDFRIYVTGTKGFARATIAGDPESKKPCLTLYMENECKKNVEMKDPETNVTDDFLNRIEGKDYYIGHNDILKAVKTCIDFDEKAKIINRI